MLARSDDHTHKILGNEDWRLVPSKKKSAAKYTPPNVELSCQHESEQIAIHWQGTSSSGGGYTSVMLTDPSKSTTIDS